MYGIPLNNTNRTSKLESRTRQAITSSSGLNQYNTPKPTQSCLSTCIYAAFRRYVSLN